MDITRRSFLKIAGGTLAAAGIGTGVGVTPALAMPRKVQHAQEVPTICPYCGVGCGIIVHVKNGKVINTEGDPDHPVNRGALCAKGLPCSRSPTTTGATRRSCTGHPGLATGKRSSGTGPWRRSPPT